jgi:signal transduction histidine kinase
VDAWLTRTYERHGPRYVRGVIALLIAAGVFVVGPIVVQIAAHYEQLSLGQSALMLLVIDVGILLGAGLTVTARRTEIRALVAWSAGERAAAIHAAAEEAAFQTPRRLAIRITVFAVLIPTLIGTTVALALAGHWAAVDYVFAPALCLISSVMAGIVVYFVLDLAYRPIRATFRRTTAETISGSIAARLILILVFLSFDSGLWVGVLNQTRAEGAGSLATGVLASALLVTACQTLVLVFLVSVTVRGPIHDLITGTRRIGAGGMGWRVPVTTSDEFAELTTSFNRMAEDLGRRNDELHASQARIVASSDEARRKVERDLHDGAQQHLVLLDLKLGMLKRALESDPAKAAAITDEAKADLDRALAELRDLAHGIYPSVLGNDGLAPALSEAAQRAAIPTSVESGGTGRHPPELEAAVYFCCLEALQNTGKYAGEGARATVQLSTSDGALRFEVSDDGQGFDPATVNGSAGLQNMTDRIGALGGELRIESKPGKGTTVAGSVPLGG